MISDDNVYVMNETYFYIDYSNFLVIILELFYFNIFVYKYIPYPLIMLHILMSYFFLSTGLFFAEKNQK